MAEATKKLDDTAKRALMKRIKGIRSALLQEYPFYGMLLMRLKFVLANCGTAATDMEKIYFDPAFVSGLTNDELVFVILHELMHCVLNHVDRGRGRNHYLFNIAADIVVNSNIMFSLGYSSFCIDGTEVMHLAPDGTEGHFHTAEEVYDQLLDKYKKLLEDVDSFLEELEEHFGKCLDNHDIWETIPLGDSLPEEWKNAVRKTIENTRKSFDSMQVPAFAREFEKEENYRSRLNWRSILQEFIQMVTDRYEYTYRPSNKRVLYQDMILPSYSVRYGEEVDEIWFPVDTSASMSPKELSVILAELHSAISQIGRLRGKISSFDTRVTEPVEFDGPETLDEIKLSGGGGTSFSVIFEYMKKNMSENLPKAVIVLTDGFCNYPPEEAALGVPVLWIMTAAGDEKYGASDAPWGRTIHLPVMT